MWNIIFSWDRPLFAMQQMTSRASERPFPRFVFFLEVILKFIDKTPEETRDEKYAEDFKDLKKRVIDALKKKDPDYAPWCNW